MSGTLDFYCYIVQLRRGPNIFNLSKPLKNYFAWHVKGKSMANTYLKFSGQNKFITMHYIICILRRGKNLLFVKRLPCLNNSLIEL